jgi:hypothetical protein
LWKSELARIRAVVSPNSFLFFVLSGDLDWRDDQVVGGVIAPAFWCPLETEGQRCSPPTMEGSVVASERLKGDCAEIGNDLVFSDRFLRALKVPEIASLPVSVKDIKDAQPWRKLLPGESDCRPLLDHRFFYAAVQPCALCGRPLLPRRGVWVLRPDVELSDERAEFDHTAYDHDLGRHACIIGSEGIRRLHGQFGYRAFRADPVLGPGPLLDAMTSLQNALGTLCR